MLASAIRIRTSRSGSSAAARSPSSRSSSSRRASSGSLRCMWTHDSQYCARMRSAGRPPLASSWPASASAGPARTTSRIRAYASPAPRRSSPRRMRSVAIVREVGVRLRGLRVAARGEVEVRVDARPAARMVGEQRVGRRAQPRRQVVERSHRRLRVPQLERADVRLRVAIARQLLLGEVRGQARGTDARPDGLGQCALVDDDPAPGLELGVGHAADHTPGQVLVDRRSTLRRNSPSGTPSRSVIRRSAGSEGTVRPCSTADTNALRERRPQRLLGEAGRASSVAELESQRDPPCRVEGRRQPALLVRSSVD